MADYKVITRGEVNELVPGTFDSDLNKAVIYSELASNPAFIIGNNQCTGEPYGQNQALLEADIQVVSDVYIRLTITQNPVAANVTSNTFVIVTNGIDNSTLGWDQAGSSWVTACTVDGTNLTGSVGFPANTMYNPNTVTVSVTGTSVLGETVTGTASFVQSRVEVTPSLSIRYTGSNVSSASGNTNAFNITANYVTVTGYTVTSPASVDTSATGATTVKINYPANTAENTRTFTVTVRGRDVYGVEKTATCTFTQSSDAYTFSLSPSSSTVEFTTTTKTLTINKSNVNNVAVCAHTNTTSETISGNNLILGFNINHETYERTISVTLSGRTAGGRAVSCSATITQSGASGLNLAIVYSGNALPAASGTTNEFSISAGESVTVTGYSVDIAGASMENTGATQATLRYPANPTDSPVTYTVTVYASTPTGNTSASTTVIQAADAYSFALAPDANPVAAETTLALFTITSSNVSNIGYVASGSENVVSCTISGGKARATINVNTGADRNITVRISGTTVGGRTVYTTATTVQSAPSSYTFDLIPVGGEMSYVAASATSHDYEIWCTNINDETIGVVRGGTTSDADFDYNTGVGTFDANTDADREITIQISAKTLSDETVYADATVIQLGYHSEAEFITITPDGTSVLASVTSVTFNVSWNYATSGHNITFTTQGASTTPASITNPPFSGTTALTVAIQTNTSSTSKQITLTGSMTDVVGTSHSDSGYYVQQASRSRFEFQNDFTVNWDVTSATITFTYAYLTNNSVSLAATGGAYFNSGLTQPSSAVSITPNASSRTGSFTIYFAKNDSPSQIEYVITATGNQGEAGESSSLSDSITVTHNIPDGASLVLTPCSTTYYWNTDNVTFNLDWTNINPGTSSNPGITITVSNGATATPNKYYSGNDGDENFVVSGFAPGNSYTVTVTGRPYVGDNITRTYTITIPAKPAGGSITVRSGSDWHLDGSAGSETFTVTWQRMMAGSTISLSGSNGMSGISPSSITVSSSGSGTTTVNFNYSALSSGSRDLKLTARGTDRNGDSKGDTDLYRQHGTGGTGGSTLVVSATTSSPVSDTTTSVTFRVTWSNVWGTVNISPSIGTASTTSTEADGNGHVDVTVTMGANTGTSSRTIRLTGTAPFNSLNDYAEIVQNGGSYPSGSIDVASRSSYHLDGASGRDYFDVTWEGLKVGSTITLSGSSGMSGISPSSISVDSVDGSETVYFNYSALSSGSRDLTLTATGTDRNGDSQSDSDYYTQHGKGGSGGSVLDVVAITSSPVSHTATTVQFTVSGSNIYYQTVNISSNIGTVSRSSIDPGTSGSFSQTITVTMGANTGGSSRTITLTASTAFNSMTDNDSIIQNPGITYVTISLENEIDITANNDTTYRNQPYVQVFLATGTTDSSIIATWNSDFETDPVMQPGGHVTGTLNLDSVSGEYSDRVVVPSGTQLYLIVETDVLLTPSPGTFSGHCTFVGRGLDGSEKSVSMSVDDSPVDWRGYVSLGQANSNTTYTSGSFSVTYSATAYHPDIWWTKTSGGSSSTAVSSVSDVPAYVPGTYNGRNVEYTIYLNWNTDVYSVDMDTTSLTNGASATRDGKVVTITAPVNSGSSRSLGSITVTGTAQDEVTTDTARLTITQVAGGSVSSLLIEGVTSYTDSVNIPASGGSATYNFSYSNVGDIGTTYLSGAVTGATASTSTLKLTVGFIANSTQYARSWGASVTGHTVFGTMIKADVLGTQDAPVVEEYFYWVPRPGLHTTAATSNVLSTSGTTSMDYETNIPNIKWSWTTIYDGFTVDTGTSGVVSVQYPANTGSERTFKITARKGLLGAALGTWTINQAAGEPVVENVTVSLTDINIMVLANQRYGVLGAAAWIQTGSTYSQSYWPSTNIISGTTTNDGLGHNIRVTSSSVSLTVPKGTTIYIFADGKGITEAAYMKTDVNSAEAILNVSTPQSSTVTLEPASPGYYYMRGSFVATKNTTISVSGNFTARG